MGHLSTYISSIASEELATSILQTSAKVCNNISERFSHTTDLTGLLLGNVQSGKTGQMLGIIARMADEGYKIFILLTTDNVDLQRQTYNRVKKSLSTFTTLSEKDEVEFNQANGRNPVIVVLKKNTSVLRKWRNLLLQPIFVEVNRSLFWMTKQMPQALTLLLTNIVKAPLINI